MVKNSVSIKLFGITQFVLFAAIVVALYLHWKRSKERKKGESMTLNSIYIRDSIRRTPVTAQTGGGAGDTKEEAAQIESALPTWTKDTPPYEILGIPPSSDSDTVEAAYKKLLKRYHPDRFASWGRGYQTRAHQVVLLLQLARDKMLGK